MKRANMTKEQMLTRLQQRARATKTRTIDADSGKVNAKKGLREMHKVASVQAVEPTQPRMTVFLCCRGLQMYRDALERTGMSKKNAIACFKGEGSAATKGIISDACKQLQLLRHSIKSQRSASKNV